MSRDSDMKYWNMRLKGAAEYIPGEQPEQPDLDGFIKLNTNENPFAPSRSVLDAIKAAANENLRRYPDPSSSSLRRAFAEAKGISPSNIFVGNGSDEIFTLIFRGFIEQDGIAAFPHPSYSLYYTLAQMSGIRYDTINLNADFSYNLAGFLKKKYGLIIIANPNNPTGTYCPTEDIRTFLGKFKGLLVIDEAYIDFYGGSAASLIKEFRNLIVTQSMSKSYSLAGLRIGFAIADEGIVRGFMKIKDSYNVDRVAEAGAVAALKDTRSFNYNIQMVLNNKEYLEDGLEKIGFSIIPSRANFFFARHPGIGASELYQRLKEMRILVRHFNEPPQSDYIRISVGTMMEIKSLLKAIMEIIGS
jgi:histidinol-phosphate aminotransferase